MSNHSGAFVQAILKGPFHCLNEQRPGSPVLTFFTCMREIPTPPFFRTAYRGYRTPYGRSPRIVLEWYRLGLLQPVYCNFREIDSQWSKGHETEAGRIHTPSVTWKELNILTKLIVNIRGHNTLDTPWTPDCCLLCFESSVGKNFELRQTIGATVTITAQSSFLRVGFFLKISRLKIKRIHHFGVTAAMLMKSFVWNSHMCNKNDAYFTFFTPKVKINHLPVP